MVVESDECVVGCFPSIARHFPRIPLSGADGGNRLPGTDLTHSDSVAEAHSRYNGHCSETVSHLAYRSRPWPSTSHGSRWRGISEEEAGGLLTTTSRPSTRPSFMQHFCRSAGTGIRHVRIAAPYLCLHDSPLCLWRESGEWSVFITSLFVHRALGRDGKQEPSLYSWLDPFLRCPRSWRARAR